MMRLNEGQTLVNFTKVPKEDEEENEIIEGEESVEINTEIVESSTENDENIIEIVENSTDNIEE